MQTINRSAIVAYSCQQMFALVEDIESYPAFLPWCDQATLIEQTEQSRTAQLGVSFKGLKQRFTTRNTSFPYHRIDMTLVEGPFSQLDGRWEFAALSNNACKITLDLKFDFSRLWLEKMVGPVFGIIGNTMVDSFHDRAKVLYVKA